MKRVSLLTILALALGLPLSALAAEMIHSVTHAQLEARHGVVIDTRISAFYNGWPQTPGATSGHETGALNLSATWLSAMSDIQLAEWAQDHGLKPATPIALYGASSDTQAVAERFARLRFTSVSVLSDALKVPGRLERLENYQQLVYPQWLHDVQQGKAVADKPAGEVKILEAGWGKPKYYLLSHIPGAGYIDTNEVEAEPLWNTVANDKLKAMLARHGIRHDTTVILYARDVFTASRVAQIMLYAGVKDVRLLDGGWKTWSAADLPVERGLPASVKPAPDFGATIPAQPQLTLGTDQARALLHRQDASLVSIRSWPEFIGTTSGYSYIKPMGDIAGARWGHGGSDSQHMEDFHNPDGTMRSAADITAMWGKWDIQRGQQVAFYCGTGWRAAEAFMYARAMGWPGISVYDGGWYEWSSNAKNPTSTGERGPASTR